MRSPTFPPQPSVEHLTTIFRRIEAGRIVVPAFQRVFVWEQEDVLALLQSVYAGYPIGSLLLWASDDEVLRVSDSPEIPFPRINPVYPINYVLDGLQRLSSLYGVFHWNPDIDRIFDVSFELETRDFIPSSECGLLGTCVPLNALFNPRRLLDVQKSIIDRGSPDETLTALTDLQSRFQDYMIPLVTLAERELDEVVIIFERVNSTGTKLSRVDFMRAITWSSRFDLNTALDRVRSQLETFGYEISDDTVVKALGLIFDLDPLPDILLDLRKRSADDLQAAIDRAIDTFRRVFAFVRERLFIHSSEFIPYEGQILTLFRVFRDRAQVTDQQALALRSWFFWVSFEEVLQGRPDNFVARMIRRVNDQLETGEIDLPRVSIDPDRFFRRRMLKGKALTSAFVTMMSLERPISPVSGRELEGEEFTGSYNTSAFVPIVTLERLQSMGISASSPKVPANVLMIHPGDELPDGKSAIDVVAELSQTDEGKDILRRQFIDEYCSKALADGQHEDFVFFRSEFIAARASEMISIPRQ